MRSSAAISAQEIARLRMRSLWLTKSNATRSAEVVGWLGAMQAQDYQSALWAIGVRVPPAGLAEVENALARREIVRTWPMRGTLHFVPAQDLRWMLPLLTPRVLKAMEGRQQQLGLDRKTFDRCAQLFARELQGGRCLARSAIFALMDRDGISSAGGRGYHIVCRLAQEGLLCFGMHAGKEPTFVLLDEWVPASTPLSRDAALAEIARRYFRSHGPATLLDFAGWTGLTMKDARAGLEAIAPEFWAVEFAGSTHWVADALRPELPPTAPPHLLPAFDEHLLGYKDRSAVLLPENAGSVVPGNNGIFQPTVVLDGQVVGLWKRRVGKGSLRVEVQPFAPLNKTQLRAVEAATAAYAAFVGKTRTRDVL